MSVDQRKWDNCHLLIRVSAAGGGNGICVNPSVCYAQESQLQGEFSLLGLEEKKEDEAEEKKKERLN